MRDSHELHRTGVTLPFHDHRPTRRIAGGAYRLRTLLSEWWQHRASFFISLGITLAALGIYFFTFLGDRSTPLFDFLKRFEYSTLDTRFRYRPARYSLPDSRIVIVSIDQRSQEVLGKWPFSRKYFGEMLDALHEDGAKVAAFDITFDKPDMTAAPVQALLTKLEQDKQGGRPPDAKVEAQVAELAKEFDSDAQFAAALRRFGPVVLGNFFLEPQEVRGIDGAVLDKYAEMVQWYSLNRAPLNPASGKKDFEALLNGYQTEGTLYTATVANIPALAPPENNEQTAIGFFNISSDADGVLRRSLLVLPFGRSNNPDDIDLYGSLEVQTLRLYLGLKTEQITVNYGPTGIATLQLGKTLTVRPDYLGRMMINYRGPRGTYPYYSLADVVQHRVSARDIPRQDCAGGGFGDGDRRFANAALWGNRLSGDGSACERDRQHAERGISGARRASGCARPSADRVVRLAVGICASVGRSAMDLVWTGAADSLRRADVPGVCAWMVAEFHGARGNAGGKCDVGFAVPGAG